MKTLINLRNRVSAGDVIAIYTMAVIDIALTAIVVGLTCLIFI